MQIGGIRQNRNTVRGFARFPLIFFAILCVMKDVYVGEFYVMFEIWVLVLIVLYKWKMYDEYHMKIQF